MTSTDATAAADTTSSGDIPPTPLDDPNCKDPMACPPLKWALIGCGRVSHDFCQALKHLPTQQVVACATASDLSRAQAFATMHDIPHAFGSYEELVQQETTNVDIVYVGNVHSLRRETGELCLNAGKHLLLEKPFACSEEDAKYLIDLARSKDLFLMEGLWTNFFPAVEKARQVVRNGQLGEIVQVTSDFNFYGADTDPYPTGFIYNKKLGGGAGFLVAPYCLAAASNFFPGHPNKVRAVGQVDATTGVELQAAVVLEYPPTSRDRPDHNYAKLPDAGVASLSFGFLCETAEETLVVGTKGRLKIHAPAHCPTKMTLELKATGRGQVGETLTYDYPLPLDTATILSAGGWKYPNSAGFCYEAAAVARCITAGMKECPQMPLDQTLRNLKLMEEVRWQLGVATSDIEGKDKRTKQRIINSLTGMMAGDALAMPVHWYYSPTKLRKDYYGDNAIDGGKMVAPLPTHAESMVQGMSYKGSIDILHDKKIYYAGYTAEGQSGEKPLTSEQIAARRDDHGNFVGATGTCERKGLLFCIDVFRKDLSSQKHSFFVAFSAADERVHYHQSLQAGQNTANACIARLLTRYLAETNANQQDYYDPDEFLERFVGYMTRAPSPHEMKADTSQVLFHNDTYLDVYIRGFFTNASSGDLRLRDCAMSQRDSWSIGSLDGVLMTIPIIAAYSNEPESMVIGRAVEHHMLTHRSVSVTMVVSILVPLLLDLYHAKKDLKTALEEAMAKMKPPRCTGREMHDSYVEHRGPGNIPKHEKWLQHMEFVVDQAFFPDFIDEMMARESDEDVAGWGDRPNSRLSTACYCEQTFSIVLYLCYKYRDDPVTALVQNALLGGHSTARGSVMGAILGGAHDDAVLSPLVDQLSALELIEQEAQSLVASL